MSSEDPKAMAQQPTESEAVQGQKQSPKDSPGTTVVELGAVHAETHRNSEANSDDASPVLTFAIEEKDKNSAKNPFHESTQVCPTLVRRIDSQELMPRPFKSTGQLVCASYLSMLCCCACAAFAVKHAWRAKIKRNQGLYTSAVQDAKWSCYLLIAAMIMGSIIWLAIIAIAIVKYS